MDQSYLSNALGRVQSASILHGVQMAYMRWTLQGRQCTSVSCLCMLTYTPPSSLWPKAYMRDAQITRGHLRTCMLRMQLLINSGHMSAW